MTQFESLIKSAPSYESLSSNPEFIQETRDGQTVFLKRDSVSYSNRKDKKFPVTLNVDREQYYYDTKTKKLRAIKKDTLYKSGRNEKAIGTILDIRLDESGNVRYGKQWKPEDSGSRQRMILKREFNPATNQVRVSSTTVQSDVYTPRRKQREKEEREKSIASKITFAPKITDDPGMAKKIEAAAGFTPPTQKVKKLSFASKLNDKFLDLDIMPPSPQKEPKKMIKAFGSGNTYRTLTPQEQKAIKKRPGVISGFSNFFDRVSVRLGLSSEELAATPQRDIRTMSGKELSGFFGGAAISMYSAVKLPEALRAASKVSKAGIKKIGETALGKTFHSAAQSEAGKKIAELSSSRVGTWLKGLGAAELVTKSMSLSTKPLASIGATPQEKKFMRSTDFNKVISQALKDATPSIGFKEGKSKASQLPGQLKKLPGVLGAELNIGLVPRDPYIKSVQSQLEGMGYNPQDVGAGIGAALKYRKIGTVTEFAGLLGLSSIAEETGRTLSSKSLAKLTTIPKDKAGWTIFKKVAPTIGAAGFIEGFGQERLQQNLRFQDKDIKKALAIGGIGAASAGLLGGGIAATALTKPKTSKALNLFANIADPLEYPGDKLADVGEFAARKMGFKSPFRVGLLDPTKRTKDIFKVLTLTPSLSLTTTQTPSSIKTTQKTTSPVNINSLIGAPVPTPDTSMTATIMGTPLDILPLANKPQPTPTPIKPFSPTPVNIPVPTDIITSLFTPTPTPTETPAETPTETTTPTPTLTPVMLPTVTPMPRLWPPVPLGMPSLGGGVGTFKGKKSKFINELDKSQKIFKKLMGGKL